MSWYEILIPALTHCLFVMQQSSVHLFTCFFHTVHVYVCKWQCIHVLWMYCTPGYLLHIAILCMLHNFCTLPTFCTLHALCTHLYTMDKLCIHTLHTAHPLHTLHSVDPNHAHIASDQPLLAAIQSSSGDSRSVHSFMSSIGDEEKKKTVGATLMQSFKSFLKIGKKEEEMEEEEIMTEEEEELLMMKGGKNTVLNGTRDEEVSCDHVWSCRQEIQRQGIISPNGYWPWHDFLLCFS